MSKPNLLSTIRSESLKFRTVRSTIYSLATFVILTVGFSTLISLVTKNNWSHIVARGEGANFDPLSRSEVGFFFGQFAIGVVGAIMITSEYASGSIRSTLAAEPRRTRVVLAKVTVLLGVTIVLSELCSFVSFFIGQSIFRGVVPTASISTGIHENLAAFGGHVISISGGTVLRALVLGGLYATLLALLGFGIGLLLRTTAASISVFVVLLLVLSIVVNFLPSNWQSWINPYLPASLGQGMTSVLSAANQFTWLPSTLILSAYCVALITVGTILMNRRDA